MKRCEWCGEAFEPVKPWQRFCSEACRIRAHRAGAKQPLDDDASRSALVADLARLASEWESPDVHPDNRAGARAAAAELRALLARHGER